MSSSKYDKIGNYNLSYEILKDAVKEFQGYVLGLSQNDIWLFAKGFDSLATSKPTKDENLIKFLNELAPRVLDRTTGSYFFINLLRSLTATGLKNHTSFGSDDYFPKQVMTVVPGYYPQNLGGTNLLGQSSAFVSAMRGFNPSEDIITLDTAENITNNVGVAKLAELTALGKEYAEAFGEEHVNITSELGTDAIVFYNAETEKVTVLQAKPITSKLATINDCLYHYDVHGLTRQEVKKEVKDKATGELTLETQYEDEDKKEAKMFAADVAIDNTFLNAPEINKQSDGIPDRSISPALSALVIQHPKAGNAAKGKDHLPIFFNAIPPIEMARCVPYIDIRVLTENYQIDKAGSKTGPSKLNNAAYMRFIKEKSGKFILDDAIGFNNLKPVGASIDQDERSALENIDVAYMDLFTSPQTLANANINKSATGEFKDLIGGNIEDDPILEPIMPFLSLESVTVSITGAGYGIMASKRGSLKLILHDRSRLRDLAPLVSVSQFATTKIIIEYGWNHPDGGAGSDNTIGKYLNSLKERSVFQVVKCDYDFSDGGAVGVNIGLAAYGFRQTERVHCGAGPEVPLNVFSEYITEAVEDLRKNVAKGDKEKVPEVRQKIKLSERAARSTSNSLSWSAYRAVMTALKSGNPDGITALRYIFELETLNGQAKIDRKKEMKTALSSSVNDILYDTISGIDIFTTLEEGGLFNEDSKETMLQRVYGKIKALETPQIVDPFISSLVYKSKILKDTLGEDHLLGDFNTSSPSLQKARFMLNEGIAADINSSTSKALTSYVTLGKAIASFIGYPLAATCLYDEVQMIFYPLNHQSAGARVHTTASLPIPISKIREEVQTAVKTNSNISVKRMFTMLERIVKDKNLAVYNVSDIFRANSEFNKKEEAEQIDAMLSQMCENPNDTTFGFLDNPVVDNQILSNYNYNINPANNFPNSKSLESGLFSKTKGGGLLRKRLVELLSEWKSQKSSKLRSQLSDKLKEIYSKDELASVFPGFDRFVRPNISLDFEVIDAIDADTNTDTKFRSRFIKQIIKPANTISGLHENKLILRLHIYDEETVMSPAEHTLMSTITEGTTGNIIKGGEISNIAKKLNFNQAKQFIKRSYPTIIYGVAGSTVRSLGVSANTSGQMANVLMMESYGNLKQAQVSGPNYESSFESVEMLPNTVSCTIMGMPMIGRGNTIFIDFGTNTSLDNIYTVKNVTHTIRAGDFSTTLDLVPSNMGSVSGFSKNLSSQLELLESEKATTLVSPNAT